MTPYEAFTLALNLLGAVILPVCLLMIRRMRSIRENELLHLQEDLREIKGLVCRVEKRLEERIQRLEERLWHLNQP